MRRLPFGEEGSAGAGNTDKQKRWSVHKRRRRSPSKQVAASGSVTPSPGSEEIKLVQGWSSLPVLLSSDSAIIDQSAGSLAQ